MRHGKSRNSKEKRTNFWRLFANYNVRILEEVGLTEIVAVPTRQSSLEENDGEYIFYVTDEEK